MRLASKISNRLRREIRHAAAFLRAKWGDTRPGERDVLMSWHRSPPPENLQGCVEEWLGSRPCLFGCDTPPVAEVPSVLQEAKRILAGKIIIFDQSCDLNSSNFWHEDPRTRQPWPADVHFTRFRIFHPSRDGITDIRRLWEAGRFGWALPLARAYAATGDPAYARAWCEHAESFIRANPPEFGPHWLNAMEVALRAIQWCQALSLFFRAPRSEFHAPNSLLPSLLAHGRYIRRYLEWTPRGRTNHYIADLVGLLTLSVFVPQFREAAECRRFATSELEREIEAQTTPENFHDEASTAYHHFVVELYTLVTALDREHHLGFSSRFCKRVEQMNETDMALCGPEDIDPRIGDDDSGALAVADWGTSSSKRSGSVSRRTSSVSFHSSDIYILRSEAISCHVACGPNGQQEVGGHAHNDKLSVVIRLQGREIVVDSGTFCYSADIAARDRFRSTAMHNTIMVDGQEQNPLEDWRMLQDRTRAKGLLWKDSANETVFQGEHSGYAEIGVIHRRTVRLDKRRPRLIFLDELEGRSEHSFDFYLHFAPWLTREEIRLENSRVELPGAEILFPGDPEKPPMELLDTFYSPIYGQQVPNLTLHLRIRTVGGWRLSWEMIGTRSFEKDRG